MIVDQTHLAAYGAAALGFLFIEVAKVSKRTPRTQFKLGYYLEQNWENLLANASASLLLLFGLSEIERIEKRYFDGESFVVLTAGFIGLAGSWILRTLIDKAKSRVPGEPTPPPEVVEDPDTKEGRDG